MQGNEQLFLLKNTKLILIGDCALGSAGGNKTAGRKSKDVISPLKKQGLRSI